jgi:tetratricopeptide (TPR) repeat protein
MGQRRAICRTSREAQFRQPAIIGTLKAGSRCGVLQAQGMRVDRDSWQQVRELFDSVCEMDPSQWRTELARLSADPQVIAETLGLLEAQTCDLGRAREPMEQLLAVAVVSELGEGDRIGPWRLCERLASGGMGIVFRAERADGLYAQDVAIKFLLGHPGARVAERLSAERRILAGLQHPNIARLYDGGSTPAGNPYLVMEYVRGEPLDQYCRRHALDLPQRLALFLKACSAVQAAHAQLVLHCDLKPSNILVREDGEPVLLDFGVSRLLEGDDSGARAQFFTAAYAAPELQSNRNVGVASDVFSLGVVLGELLAGEGARRDARHTASAVVAPSRQAGPSCKWRRKLRGDLDAIVVHAGALPAEQRYPSVEAMAADVQRYQQHRPVRARNGGRLYRAGRWFQRNWKGAAALLAMLLLAAWFVWRLGQARAEAEREAMVAEQVSGFLVSMFKAADPREKGLRAGESISAKEVLDRAAAQVDTDLDTAPEVRARLKAVIGLAYKNLGDSSRAQPLMEAAAEALAEAGGAKNIDLAAQSFNMASSTYSNDRFGKDGERLARRSLALLGEGEPDSFRVAQSYNSLGLALLSEQRYDEAEAAFKQALQRHEAGKRDQFIGVLLDNLGMLYRRKGDLAASLAAFDRSTPMFQRMFGEMSFDYWGSTTERTLALADSGRLEEAVTLFEANLARAPKIFGGHSVYVSSENNRLAATLIRKGEFARAQPYVDEALRLTVAVKGKDSYSYSLVLETAALLAAGTGDLAKAEADYRTVLATREAVIGADHPDTLDAALQLGLLLTQLGKVEGDALMLRTYQQWLPRIPAESANGIRVRQGRAEWLISKGRLDEAASLLETLEPVVQGSPFAAIHQRVLRAQLAQQRGAWADAVTQWEATVAAAASLYGKDSAITRQWQAALAAARVASAKAVH